MEFFTWMTWKIKFIMVFMLGMTLLCLFKFVTLLATGNPWFLFWAYLVFVYLNFFYERSLDWKSFKLRMVDEPEKKSHTFYL